jgi:hypothetical protein
MIIVLDVIQMTTNQPKQQMGKEASHAAEWVIYVIIPKTNKRHDHQKVNG